MIQAVMQTKFFRIIADDNLPKSEIWFVSAKNWLILNLETGQYRYVEDVDGRRAK